MTTLVTTNDFKNDLNLKACKPSWDWEHWFHIFLLQAPFGCCCSWCGPRKKLRKFFFSYFGKPKAGLVVYQPIQKPKFQKHKNLVVWLPILGEFTPEHRSYEFCTFLLRCSNQGLIGWRIWNNEKIEIGNATNKTKAV